MRSKADCILQGAKVGTRRSDCIVEGQMVLEIKTLAEISEAHIVQTKNYTVAYDL
jgi:hypothetical protein